MSRTDKDTPAFRRSGAAWSIYTPSWFHRIGRRADRRRAKQHLRAGQEPEPRYPGYRAYWW